MTPSESIQRNGSDPYLPLKELARYSGLSVRTLRAHLADRMRPLPHYRIVGKILVRRSEFDAWVQQFRKVDDGREASDIIDHIVNSILR